MTSMPLDLPDVLRKEMEHHATRIAYYAQRNASTLCGFLEEDPDSNTVDALIALLSVSEHAAINPAAVHANFRELAFLFPKMSSQTIERAGTTMDLKDLWSCWRWHAARRESNWQRS